MQVQEGNVWGIHAERTPKDCNVNLFKEGLLLVSVENGGCFLGILCNSEDHNHKIVRSIQ